MNQLTPLTLLFFCTLGQSEFPTTNIECSARNQDVGFRCLGALKIVVTETGTGRRSSRGSCSSAAECLIPNAEDTEICREYCNVYQICTCRSHLYNDQHFDNDQPCPETMQGSNIPFSYVKYMCVNTEGDTSVIETMQQSISTTTGSYVQIRTKNYPTSVQQIYNHSCHGQVNVGETLRVTFYHIAKSSAIYTPYCVYITYDQGQIKQCANYGGLPVYQNIPVQQGFKFFVWVTTNDTTNGRFWITFRAYRRLIQAGDLTLTCDNNITGAIHPNHEDMFTYPGSMDEAVTYAESMDEAVTYDGSMDETVTYAGSMDGDMHTSDGSMDDPNHQIGLVAGLIVASVLIISLLIALIVMTIHRKRSQVKQDSNNNAGYQDSRTTSNISNMRTRSININENVYHEDDNEGCTADKPERNISDVTTAAIRSSINGDTYETIAAIPQVHVESQTQIIKSQRPGVSSNSDMHSEIDGKHNEQSTPYKVSDLCDTKQPSNLLKKSKHSISRNKQDGFPMHTNNECRESAEYDIPDGLPIKLSDRVVYENQIGTISDLKIKHHYEEISEIPITMKPQDLECVYDFPEIVEDHKSATQKTENLSENLKLKAGDKCASIKSSTYEDASSADIIYSKAILEAEETEIIENDLYN